MTVHTCRACGATLPDTARFCAVCGQTLNSTASADKKANHLQAPGKVDSLQKAEASSALSTNQPPDQVGKVALADHFSADEVQGVDTLAEGDLTKPISHAGIEADWSSIAHVGGGAPTEPIGHNSLVLPALATQGPLVLPHQDVTQQASPFVVSPPSVMSPAPYIPIHKPQKHTARSGWVTGLIILLVLMLVITSLIAIGQTILVPSIAIKGDTQVSSGGQIHLSGSSFIPDDTITLMLDSTQPLYYIGTINTVTARSDGTFDVTIPVGTNWQPGLHTIQALEGLSLRHAVVSFALNQVEQTATPTPNVPAISDGELSMVAPAVVRLGSVEEGSDQTISAQVTLITTGVGQVSWSASWDQDQTPGLYLDQMSGEIQAPASQVLTVRVQVGSLDAGTYTATINFDSPQSTQDVSLQVIFTVVPN